MERAKKQVDHELELIAKLGLPEILIVFFVFFLFYGDIGRVLQSVTNPDTSRG